MKAYLVLVTWADGTEGLLFPRPGNVPVANTPELGRADFATAKEHLVEYVMSHIADAKTPITIRLIEFERGAELAQFSIE